MVPANKNSDSHQPDVEKLDTNVVQSIFGKKEKRKKTSSLFGSTSQAPQTESQKDVVKNTRKIRSAGQGFLPVGVDVGSSSIKIAQLENKGRHLAISKLIVEELPLELVENPAQRDKQLPGILKNLCNTYQLQGNAYAALSTESVMMKNIALPQMPPAELEEALRWEVRQMAKDDLDNISYDFVVLNEERSFREEKIQILLIAIQHEDIWKYMDMMEFAGLKPLAIETESFSLAAGLYFNQIARKGEVVIALDLGAGAVKLNILKDGNLQYTRVLNISGNSLTQTIRDYCHVSFTEAERLKRKYGFSSLTQCDQEDQKHYPRDIPLQVRNAITLPFEKLVSDIEHTFKYYSYQLTKSRITNYDKIILSGGSAGFPSLVPMIYERLHVPVETDNPLVKFQIAKEALIDQENLERSFPRFGVVLGLALRGAQ